MKCETARQGILRDERPSPPPWRGRNAARPLPLRRRGGDDGPVGLWEDAGLRRHVERILARWPR